MTRRLLLFLPFAACLRADSEREVVDLMERCGLEVAEEYGDYLLSPFKKTSDVMVFVARKSA